MERPLIALAEDVGDEFLRCSIIVAEEIPCGSVGIDGVNVGQALRVRSGQIPGKSIARRADPKLTFSKVDGLHARLERKAEGTEAMLRVDTIAIEFAGSTRSDYQIRGMDDDEPERIAGRPMRRVKCQQAGDASRFVVGHQNLRAD